MSENRTWNKEEKRAGNPSGREYGKGSGRGGRGRFEKESERAPRRDTERKPERGSRKETGRAFERESRKEFGRASERGSRKESGRASEKGGWKETRGEFRKSPAQSPGRDSRNGSKPERERDISRKADAKRATGGKEKQRLCPVASKCGSCQWINKSYEEQLEAKATRFRKLMEPYCRPEPIIAMEQPAHYRCKVHAVFGEDRKHGIISGTYEEKSHRIVPIDSCLIENRKADEIIVSIRGLLKSFKLRPYNEDTGFGLLRHVLIRVGYATGQIMVVLVLAYPVLPSKKNFVKALLQLHPEITTIVINVNSRDTSMVLGDKEEVIYGKGYIEDELCGMTFRISPRSFYQVNPAQTRKLYDKAMEYARLTGKETVLDAYCGTGTIGMIASRQAAKVLGVELNKEAVRDAISNAKYNQVSNIRFYQRDAGEFLLQMAENQEKLDVLLMDPPRSGSSEAFLKAVTKIRPGRIVYVSCNPDTLVQDLKILVKGGYKTEKCVAVDMFPYTDGMEAVVALSL